jgi:hypothetical protein
MKVLVILLLMSCSTMRQRTVVVSVYDYPMQLDSVKIPADSVVHYRQEIRKQENKKNFWKGATITLFLFILLEIFVNTN